MAEYFFEIIHASLHVYRYAFDGPALSSYLGTFRTLILNPDCHAERLVFFHYISVLLCRVVLWGQKLFRSDRDMELFETELLHGRL